MAGNKLLARTSALVNQKNSCLNLTTFYIDAFKHLQS